MIDLKYLAAMGIQTFASATVILFSRSVKATNTIEIACDLSMSAPTVVVTLSKQERSQASPILSFLPQYFSAQEGQYKCQNIAKKLQTFYSQGRMNYLASDTIEQKPVVCAVERRGLRCDGYSSEILFSLDRPIDPTELLYNMLGKDFKGSRPSSSRTINRIYTDLRPLWWPF